MEPIDQAPASEPGDGMATGSGAGRAEWLRGRRRVVALAGLALVVLLALLGASLVRLQGGGFPDLGRAGGASASVGRVAPDFALTLFDGETFRLSEQRGQAVVLNFWASWCAPCREEMPAFERTARAYSDVVFVGVAVQDDPAAARALLDELGITYAVGLDEDDAIAPQYRLIGMPTTVFITRDGTVARKKTGAISEDQLVAFVEEIVR